MLQTTAIALFLGFWASLYLLDSFLKGHRHFSHPYIEFLTRSGLSVSIAQLRWYTTCFNRMFMRLGQCRPHFLKKWFTCGVCFGLVAMVMSVVLLSLIVLNTLSRRPVEQQVLTPVMPGVNLPMGQIVYYMLTLFVCGVLHEVGHAIAAVREQVKVNGFGIFILGLYPGAFVELFTEQLQVISPIRQLRIYCAGVWHNFIIVLVAMVTLVVLPWILLPFYTVGQAIVVTGVVENSAVSGPRGIAVGDQVTSVGGCRVTSVPDWVTCITVAMQEQSSGYCMPTELLRQQDVAHTPYATPAGYVECCGNTSNTHLCFSYYQKGGSLQSYACLPARSTTDMQPCRLPSDCYTRNSASVCVLPSLDNSTKLLRVTFRGRAPLLFLGHPLDLHYALFLSNYVPVYHIVPVHLPYVLEIFSKYLISLSGALAILNVVPCYALDGQWILLALIELSFRSTIPNPETRGLIYTLILFFGTSLLAVNILIAMYTLFIGS